MHTILFFDSIHPKETDTKVFVVIENVHKPVL